MTRRRYKLLVAGIIALLLLSSFSCFTIVRDGNRIELAHASAKRARLTRELISEFTQIVDRTAAYTVNWVYLQTDEKSKNEFRNLMSMKYPSLKAMLTEVSAAWPAEDQDVLKQLFSEYENMLNSAKDQILANLITFEDYEDPTVKFLAENSIESEIMPMAGLLMKKLKLHDEKLRAALDENETELDMVMAVSDRRSLILSITMFLAGVIGMVIVVTVPKTRIVEDVTVSSPLAEKKVDLIKWVTALDDKTISEIERLRRQS